MRVCIWPRASHETLLADSQAVAMFSEEWRELPVAASLSKALDCVTVPTQRTFGASRDADRPVKQRRCRKTTHGESVTFHTNGMVGGVTSASTFGEQ